MGSPDNNDGNGIHGLLQGECRHCGETIPINTLACPACGKERLFDQKQYDMLIRCAVAEDISEWKEWREQNKPVPIHLEGAELWKAYLEGANLHDAHLGGAMLSDAHLEGAMLSDAHLEGAGLIGAHLEGASLSGAHLEGAGLFEAHLEGAELYHTHLEGAGLFEAHLEGADLYHAHLEGAGLFEAHLEGASARGAFVSSQTSLWDCSFDRKTDFTGAALEAANIDPALKSVLQRNIRQIGWGQWYKSNRLRRYVLSIPVRLFWWTSDYGSSTVRIMLVFLLLSAVLACVYYYYEIAGTAGVVTNMSEVADQRVPQLLLPLRALYFSVVTMTTLGFGDIHAHPQSYAGHALLMAQVILGYVLLGALITRFAIMFQGTTLPYVRRRQE